MDLMAEERAAIQRAQRNRAVANRLTGIVHQYNTGRNKWRRDDIEFLLNTIDALGATIVKLQAELYGTPETETETED